MIRLQDVAMRETQAMAIMRTEGRLHLLRVCYETGAALPPELGDSRGGLAVAIQEEIGVLEQLRSAWAGKPYQRRRYHNHAA